MAVEPTSSPGGPSFSPQFNESREPKPPASRTPAMQRGDPAAPMLPTKGAPPSFPKTSNPAKSQILQRARGTLEGSPHVRINEGALRALAASFGDANAPDWEFYLPEALQRDHCPSHMEVAYFFFVQNALQYSFWDHDAHGELVHWKKGSRSAADLAIELYDAGALPGLHLTPGEVAPRLGARLAEMPMGPTRVDTWQDVARRRDFIRIMDSARNHATGGWTLDTQLAQRFADAFPSYRDPYLKRIQLFLGMLGTNLRAKGEKVSLDLTVYADYRVPQALRHHGVLEYSPALSRRVAEREVLEARGPEDEAIRAGTIVAGHRLARLTGKAETDIDAALFLLTREEQFTAEAAPFHLVRTTDY